METNYPNISGDLISFALQPWVNYICSDQSMLQIGSDQGVSLDHFDLNPDHFWLKSCTTFIPAVSYLKKFPLYLTTSLCHYCNTGRPHTLKLSAVQTRWPTVIANSILAIIGTHTVNEQTGERGVERDSVKKEGQLRSFLCYSTYNSIHTKVILNS